MNWQTFENVWDALEDDPVKRENYKIRSELMITLAEHIENTYKNQTEAAKALGVTQPRISALKRGAFNEFRLDMLVDMALRAGLRVTVNVKAD